MAHLVSKVNYCVNRPFLKPMTGEFVTRIPQRLKSYNFYKMKSYINTLWFNIFMRSTIHFNFRINISPYQSMTFFFWRSCDYINSSKIIPVQNSSKLFCLYQSLQIDDASMEPIQWIKSCILTHNYDNILIWFLIITLVRNICGFGFFFFFAAWGKKGKWKIIIVLQNKHLYPPLVICTP